MRNRYRAVGVMCLALAPLAAVSPAKAVDVRPDTPARMKLSNRDINHIVCEGGEISDVKFSQEKAIAVEMNGENAWIKFLVKETNDQGTVTRQFVREASEFFITCDDTVYSIFSEPSDIPGQIVQLKRGAHQMSAENRQIMATLPEEDRAITVSLAMLRDRIPASFQTMAASGVPMLLQVSGANLRLQEVRRIGVDGAGLSSSEYRVSSDSDVDLNEMMFLNAALGSDIFAITLDRLHLAPGEAGRLVVVRRENAR